MKKLANTIILVCMSIIAPAQTVLPGMPSANDKVWAIVRSGNIVFVGGQFTTFGGLSRQRLAAFDANTGAVLSWNPDPDGTVFCFLIAEGKLLIGGSFNNISGTARARLAIFDLNGLSLLGNTPSSGTQVHDLKYYGGRVYYPDESSGGFDVNIKRFTISTGVIDSWQTEPLDLYFGGFFDILGNYIYIGGQFYYYTNGGVCHNFVRCNFITGAVDTAYCLGTDGYEWIENVKTWNGKLYATGSFTIVGGLSRKGAFELDVNGSVTSLDFHCSNHQNYGLFPQGNTMWIGGNSANIGGGYSYRIAQVKLSNGYATCWSTLAVSSASYVQAIFVQGDTVYLGAPDVNVAFTVLVGNPSYVSLGPDITLSQGGSAVLSTNTTFQTYLWNTGATTSSITVNTPGTYWVNVTSSTYCSASDTISVFMSTGINNPVRDFSFSIEPNPASFSATINAGAGNGTVTYEVIDLRGNVRAEGYFRKSSFDLNLSNLENGIYAVRLKTAEKAETGIFRLAVIK